LFEPVVGEIQAFGICSKDSNAMKSDNPNSGFYEADTSRTLDANGGNPNCNQGGIAVVSIQGSMIGREDKNDPAGSGFGEDVSFTLNTVDRHGVAYGIDRAAFNQGKNAKYDISIEEELNSSLVAKGPSAVGQPVCNEGDIAGTLDASYYKGPGTRNGKERCFVGEPYAVGNGQAAQMGIHDKMYALDCMHDQQAVMCGFDRYNNSTTGNITQTLTGNRLNDVPMAQVDYIVRRLTPTECARLQGFPDWWCDDIAVPEPTEDDMRFWRGVFDTYCDINGQKHKTDNQIRKWLADPHTDSAEYKMWGNGCALPNAYYVIFGIAEVLKSSGDVRTRIVVEKQRKAKFCKAMV
jgi:DNA (cytosine-5)-methyltransferase 1